LTREELLRYATIVAAGNETTTQLIGWAGKVLAQHLSQRRELADDPELIPNAIEELLRLESTTRHLGRFVVRDHRRFPPDGELFDIHRKARSHIAFGVGAHYCLGAALARLEVRIVLEEVLARFPEWDIEVSNAAMSTTSTLWGWEQLPAIIT
jgi:cytochrome P450